MTYRLELILRIFLFFGLLMLFNYFIYNSDWQIVPGFILMCVIVAILELVGFQEKQLQKVEKHLVALLHNDVSTSISNIPKGYAFNNIRHSISALIKEIGQLREAKKVAELFSEQIIEHAPNAILCYSKSGEIILANKAFTNLFGIPILSTIEQLEKFLPEILAAIEKATSKGQANYTFSKEGKECVISIQHSTFVSKKNKIHILNLHEIGSQLVGIQVESWQKLIRVLAHEIINTVTPIASLANTLYSKTIQRIGDKQSTVYLQLNKALQTIDTRSKSLVKFVEHYKMFVVNPKLHYSTFTIHTILKRTLDLLEETAQQKGGRFTLKADKNLRLEADKELLEQVLINLVLNALESSKKQATNNIILTAQKIENNLCLIRIIDEGMGMDDDTKEKIFTPFFTTKEKGSGIGLSLSRQILHLHGGTIDVYSKLEKGTAFTLELPLVQSSA